MRILQELHANFYSFRAYEDVLYQEVFSSWDERAALQCISDYNQVTKNYINKRWCIMVNHEHWQLSTLPSMNTLIENKINDPILANHSANIVFSEMQKWYISKLYESFPEISEMRFFESVSEASEWLRSLGYKIPEIEKP